MEQLLNYFVSTESVFQKGLFLMAAGILFVFAVQVIFYMTVKLWTSIKRRPKDS